MSAVWHVYYGTRGCAGNYIHALLNAFHEAGVESKAFVSCHYKFATGGVVKCFFPITDRIQTRTIGIKLIRAIEFASAYLYIFSLAVFSRPRISLSLTDDTVVTYIFFRACKMLGIPIDLVCHDIRTHEGDLPWRRLRMMSDADRIIVHSSHAVRMIRSIDVKHGKKVVEYPFPFASDAVILSANAKSRAMAEITKLTAGCPYFLFVGVVRPSKGIVELLDAWGGTSAKSLCKLVIAGKWSNVSPGVRELADSVKNCIVIDRYLSDEEFAGYIENADFVVLPYLDYTHSSVLFACADHGATVVVSNVAVFAELLPNYTLTFSKGNASEMTKILDKAFGMTDEERVAAKLLLKHAVINHEEDLVPAIKRAYN